MEKRRPIDTLVEVGERLKKVREALNLSQINLCNQINVATNTYNQWEKGRVLLDPLAAVRFAKIHGVTLDYLYRGDFSGLPYYIVKSIEKGKSYPSRSEINSKKDGIKVA